MSSFQTMFELHRKRGCLEGAMSKSTANLLRGKQKETQESVDKASDKTINKPYAYRKSLRKALISLYCTGIYQVVTLRNVKDLQLQS